MLVPPIVGQMPFGWVHAQLTNGRAIILIDGVDELPSAQRGSMLECFQQLVNSYPYARYIVTSRPAAVKAESWPEWQEWTEKESFVETSLRPMSEVHIENFIDQWHEAFAKTVGDEEEVKALRQLAGNLKRQLRQRPPLRRLADNPLLCAMICALHRERNENLPAERIELYRGCVEMLLSRRDEGRKVDLKSDYPALSDKQRLVLAQSFAYWLMKNCYSDVELGDADRHFEGKRAEMNLAGHVTGEGVRRWFVERASLLREPVAQRIDFTHRTFQEYLAAQAAIKENDIGVLLEHSRDDLWRETVILAAGEARPKERERLLKGLIAKADKLRTERYRKQLYLLAVACLETCVELAPEVRQLVLDKAAPLFPPQDDDDVKLMAAAGDPAVALLAHNPELWGSDAARCVKALAMIGSNSAMKAIADYARDDYEYWQIRDEVGYAWGHFDRHKYAQAVLTRSRQLSLENHSSWEGFEHLSHVEWLAIRKSQLKDLSPIQYLPNLRFLQLFDWNQLCDLNPIGFAQKLEVVSIQDCINICDLNPLVQLTRLSFLGLHRCHKLRDILPLARLAKLRDLFISDLPIVDLGAIAALKELTSLYVSDVTIADPDILQGLTNLKQLQLRRTKTNSLDFLVGLTELTEVGLIGEGFADLRILSTLPKLASVTVDDLQLIRHLTHLEEISILGKTKTTDLAPIVAFSNLKRISILGTQIVDLSPLAELSDLTFLNLNSSQIADLSPLMNHTKLQFLYISRTRVTDLSPLANLENLKELHLRGTPVKDLGPVKRIKGLKIFR
ncbi:MAG: hypothetical protein DKINENOH_04138 [bacterium]|nr:hypothetical protein [bacterium]